MLYYFCWQNLICCFDLFFLDLKESILQDSDSDVEVFDLLDPSSRDIVVGSISVSCSVEVCTTTLPFSVVC